MKLHIFTTGGTIDKIYFDAKSDYEVGEPVVDTILKQAHASIEYSITALMRKDSLEMTNEDREVIRDAVRDCDEDKVLITHGSDTMTETGKALVDIPSKTIVLTGSLKPARFQESDAVFNIGAAIAAVQSLPAGVYIIMNGCVFNAQRVRKNREANRFEALD
ncbi:MAG: asparaginase domain-containing protein [Gammaproteobacteria bacterium]